TAGLNTLVGYWKFDEAAGIPTVDPVTGRPTGTPTADASGNRNTGYQTPVLYLNVPQGVSCDVDKGECLPYLAVDYPGFNKNTIPPVPFADPSTMFFDSRYSGVQVLNGTSAAS